MTAPTKTAKTLLSSQSLAAGTSVDITEWDMTGVYGGCIIIRITNGSSAPTTAPTMNFYSGHATGVKRLRDTRTGDTTNSSVRDFECAYELYHMFANATITNGATNAITVEAFGQEATTI